MSRRSEARKKWHPYKSKFEFDVAANLKKRKVKFEYESTKIKFLRPAIERVYNPDFILPNGVIVETKGRLVADDRKKHLLIKEQHPELDIRFVFQRANQRINRGSPTTYGEWATKNGFIWSEKTIPKEWLKKT